MMFEGKQVIGKLSRIRYLVNELRRDVFHVELGRDAVEVNHTNWRKRIDSLEAEASTRDVEMTKMAIAGAMMYKWLKNCNFPETHRPIGASREEMANLFLSSELAEKENSYVGID